MWSIRMLMIIITMLLHLLWWCWIWCMIQIYAWFKYDVWFKDTKAINCVRWWQWWEDLRISWTWWGNLFCKQIEIFCKVVHANLSSWQGGAAQSSGLLVTQSTFMRTALNHPSIATHKQSFTAWCASNLSTIQLSISLGNQLWYAFNQTDEEFYIIIHQGKDIKAPTNLKPEMS